MPPRDLQARSARRLGAAGGCACALPGHERPSCPVGAAVALRGSVYAGLYDAEAVPSSRANRWWDRPPAGKVRLLNPEYAGDDPTVLRFAQLEID